MFCGTHDEEIKKDNIAHFMLRLAYCRTDEYRRWLLTQESRFFKHILYEQTEKDQTRLKMILKDKNVKYNTISEEEWKSLREKITWRYKDKLHYSTYFKLEEDLKKCREDQADEIILNMKKFERKDKDIHDSYFKFNWMDGKALVGSKS